MLSTARGWLQAALICLLLPPFPPPLDEGSPKQWVAEKGPKTCPRYPLTLTLTLTVRLTHAFFVVCGDMGFHGVQHERNSYAYQFRSCQIGRHSCFFRDGTLTLLMQTQTQTLTQTLTQTVGWSPRNTGPILTLTLTLTLYPNANPYRSNRELV